MSAVGSGGVLLDASSKSVGYPVLEITSVVMVREVQGSAGDRSRGFLYNTLHTVLSLRSLGTGCRIGNSN